MLLLGGLLLSILITLRTQHATQRIIYLYIPDFLSVTRLMRLFSSIISEGKGMAARMDSFIKEMGSLHRSIMQVNCINEGNITRCVCNHCNEDIV